MNYLLFFITSIFSFIFFIFYKLNSWDNFFWYSLNSGKNFSSLSGNLIIESMAFLILAIFLFIYFSNNSLKIKIENKIKSIFPKRKTKEEIKSNELHLQDEENSENNQKAKGICKQAVDNKNLSKKNIFNISESNIYLFRAISFIFLYILIIFSIIFLYKNYFELLNIINNLFWNNIILSDNSFFDKIFSSELLNILLNLIILIFLVKSIFINFNIHKKFQNYISLFFSLFTFVFVLNFLLKIFFSNKILNFSDIEILKNQFILNLTISFFIIIFTYIFIPKYNFDNIFLHFCAIIVNFMWIIYFFINWGFSFINLLIIILLNIFLFWLSYFKLKK